MFKKHRIGKSILVNGDSAKYIKKIKENSISAVVTDAPYGLWQSSLDTHKMLLSWLTGKDFKHSRRGYIKWDEFIPQPSLWKECYRVLKPGGYLLCFFSTRTYDIGTLAIRLAGFEIRDTMSWIFTKGFPVSANIAKRIKNSKKAKLFAGYQTALKPACEFIVIARKKPESTNIIKNVLKHGTGGLNIGECRVKGRWPTNLVYDGSDEVRNEIGKLNSDLPISRLFFAAKVSRQEREAGLKGYIVKEQRDHRPNKYYDYALNRGFTKFYNNHPTLKPLALMEWLVTLVSPPKGGIILDPFAGSFTTGCAAIKKDVKFIGIEKEERYFEIGKRRMEYYFNFEQSRMDKRLTKLSFATKPRPGKSRNHNPVVKRPAAE